jgi:hypothetical protein
MRGRSHIARTPPRFCWAFPVHCSTIIAALEARIEVLKAEAIRRDLRRAEGEAYRIVLTPPGTGQRNGGRSASCARARWRARRFDPDRRAGRVASRPSRTLIIEA